MPYDLHPGLEGQFRLKILRLIPMGAMAALRGHEMVLFFSVLEIQSLSSCDLVFFSSPWRT